MAILNIEETAAEGNYAQLALSGEIDLDTVNDLKGCLTSLQERGVERLVIDMTETRYVNSSALAVLVKFAERFRERGGGIGLVNVSSRVKLVFEMLGLLVFFKFFDSVDEAKAAFPAEAR